MEIADAERAVDGLAAWHATWWGKALELAERGVTVSLGDPIYKAVLPMVFAEGWEKLGKELTIPDAIARGRPPLDRRHAAPRRRPRHGADHDDPRRLAGRQPALRSPTARWPPSTSSSSARHAAPTTSPTSSPRASTAAVAAQHEQALFDRWVSGRRGRRRPARGHRHRVGRLPQGRAVLPRLPRRRLARHGRRRPPPGRPGHDHARPLRPSRRRARPRRPAVGLPGGSAGSRRTLASRNPHAITEGSSSTGRAAVSKTAGWGFESLLPCTSHP